MIPGKIDIIAFNAPAVLSWSLGNIYHLPFSVISIQQFINTIDTDATHLLFWDYKLGHPNIDLVTNLSASPIDIWHAGLKAGVAALPAALNYIEPTWMYNKNAEENIEHTSFRFTFRAAFVNIDILKRVGISSAPYTSVDMLGISFGYKAIKQGAIIRHHPLGLSVALPLVSASGRDEWLFLKEFFPAKWQTWAWLNMPAKYKNYKLWKSVNNVKRVDTTKNIHPSQHLAGVKYDTPKVSVLAPTLDRYSYLLNELDQLSKQTILPHEALITDQTDEARRQKIDTTTYPQLTIKVFPQSEKGQCIAWNKLLEEATGDYVLFLGDDADEIQPHFIEKLFNTMQRFNADMVASHVIEYNTSTAPINHHYYLADTFPITLIKRSVLLKTGFMDMFFNKNIRADHELAMRCHLHGTLMIFDSSAIIYHHRAPVGGLRTHNARVVTGGMAKKSLTKFLVPTSSEVYLYKKYYTPAQVKNYIRIKFLNQLFVQGTIFRKLARLLVFVFKYPSLLNRYKANERLADEALKAPPVI